MLTIYRNFIFLIAIISSLCTKNSEGSNSFSDHQNHNYDHNHNYNHNSYYKSNLENFQPSSSQFNSFQLNPTENLQQKQMQVLPVTQEEKSDNDRQYPIEPYISGHIHDHHIPHNHPLTLRHILTNQAIIPLTFFWLMTQYMYGVYSLHQVKHVKHYYHPHPHHRRRRRRRRHRHRFVPTLPPTTTQDPNEHKIEFKTPVGGISFSSNIDKHTKLLHLFGRRTGHADPVKESTEIDNSSQSKSNEE